MGVRMRRYARLLAIVLAGVGVLTFQALAKPRPDASSIDEMARSFSSASSWRDRVAPDFEIALLDGRRVRLADHVGREVIVLNFFATWCGPCRAEMPELERFYRAESGNGVFMLAVDAEEKHTAVQNFVSQLRISIPVGIDGSGDIGKLYDVSAFPTTVVIGADGRVKLYEVAAIANADVSLVPLIAPEKTAIQQGRGVTAEAYRRALAEAPARGRAADAPSPLTGRPLAIAEAMVCPCGCDDKVSACSCDTAKKIRTRLGADSLDGKTDVEVIEALNREFCVKGK